jgi:hypothetical protein
MARALFLVIESRESWWVDFEGAARGPFASIQEAAVAAQEDARAEAGRGTRQCDVLAPDGNGRFWRIWSSAQDRTAAPAQEEPAAPPADDSSKSEAAE